MSKFKWCNDTVCKGKCDDFAKDGCDGCNMFEAYVLGMMEMGAGIGKWIDIEDDRATCSVCGETTPIKDTSKIYNEFPHCPKCAAIMRKDS